jgi:hypothetical protein
VINGGLAHQGWAIGSELLMMIKRTNSANKKTAGKLAAPCLRGEFSHIVAEHDLPS